MLTSSKFLLFALIINCFTTLTPVYGYAHGNDLPDSPSACMQSNGHYDCNLCTCPLIPGYLIAIFIVYALSLIISLIPIIGFLISSKLREPPGDFFFILSLSGGIGAITMLFEGIYDLYTNLGADGNDGFCIGFATSSDFTKRVTRCYNVAFMVYFMIGLRFTLKQSKIPKILYHVIPLLVSAALTIKLGVNNELGKAIDGTCGTKSSTDSSGAIAEVVLCCIMVLVFFYMLKYLSGHRTRLEDAAKKQLRYYLRYFLIANLVLLFTCVQSLIESIGMENYLARGGPLNYTGAREVLVARQSGILKDLISTIGITAVRVFDPFLRDSWREIFSKIFCLSLAKRSRASTMTSSLNDDLIDEENKNRRLSPTAQEVREAMKSQAALIQLQHHKKVQTTYSLLASIHYYYNSLANKLQSSQSSVDVKFPGVDLTRERVNEKHVYPINRAILEENLPEIVEEIKTKSYDIVKGKLTVYAPTIFGALSQLDCVTNKLLASLELNKNDSRILKSGLGEGGRGGEFFFFSTDNKFIIKTINSTELKVLLEILPRYTQHFKDHPNSLISKIYGAFTFEVKSPSESFHFIMMRNVNGYPGYCTERKYDLKGSTVDRTVTPAEQLPLEALKTYGTMKDGDFDKYEAKMYISSQKQREMMGNLTDDVNFLSSEGLIDYSMIVYIVDKLKVHDPMGSRTNSVDVEGVEMPINETRSARSFTEASQIYVSMVKTGSNEIGNPLVSIRSTKEALYYHVGIIDYLQKFTFKKRVEKFWKQLKAVDFNLDVSSQDPETYSWRFMRYMRQIILQRKVF